MPVLSVKELGSGINVSLAIGIGRILSLVIFMNPIALRKAKSLWSFGLSEWNRGKLLCLPISV